MGTRRDQPRRHVRGGRRCVAVAATRPAVASVWPDDPRWYESAAGRAADAVTPHGRPGQRQAVPTSSLTSPQRAAADLVQRWRPAPPEVPPAPIPSGPATLRYLRYDEPHEDYGVHREGAAVLVVVVPDTDPAAP